MQHIHSANKDRNILTEFLDFLSLKLLNSVNNGAVKGDKILCW